MGRCKQMSLSQILDSDLEFRIVKDMGYDFVDRLSSTGASMLMKSPLRTIPNEFHSSRSGQAKHATLSLSICRCHDYGDGFFQQELIRKSRVDVDGGEKAFKDGMCVNPSQHHETITENLSQQHLLVDHFNLISRALLLRDQEMVHLEHVQIGSHFA